MKRSIRLLPPVYAPSLVFSHGKKYNEQTFCTLSDGCYHLRSVPEMRKTRCIASCHGWLILQSYHSNECYLLNPATLAKIYLPPLKSSSFDLGVLTYPPEDPHCVVMAFSKKRKTCIFCRVFDKNWTEQSLDHKRKDPIFKIGYISAVSCNGKICLFSNYGMAVIDVRGNLAIIETHKRRCTRDLSLRGFIRFSKSFVESCGEIFQIIRLHLGASREIIERLDVYKLDFSTMAWAKVESLGDRIFCLGTTSISLSSTELGVKGNCIYFCGAAGDTTLYRFDMDDGTITSSFPCPKTFSKWRGPFWVVPVCNLQVKAQLTKVKDAKCDSFKEKRNERDLPMELLELIMSHLFLGDCIRFRLTCKDWLSITPPIRSYNMLLQSTRAPQRLPWLLTFPVNKKGQCRFYHPIYSDQYATNSSELAGAVVRHAQYGWLLMSRGKHSFFFFNPFTKETIKIPDFDYCNDFVNITFSCPPTSSDCVVFGHNCCDPQSLVMSVYHKTRDAWKTFWIEPAESFLPSYCNSIFSDGVFYSIGKDGRLGVFYPQEEEEDKAWRLLPLSKIPVPEISSLPILLLWETSISCFLVEYDGEILSIFVGFHGKPIWIFKLVLSEMKWVASESLGDKVLFLSRAASMLVPAEIKGIQDRIYFPRFQGQESLYYSLRSRSYHFGWRNSQQGWIGTTEHLDCTWLY